MKVDYEPEKNDLNIEKHGVSFERVYKFRFDTCIRQVDERKDYSETRINALGYLGKRIYILTYVKRDKTIRVISFRQANKREQAYYAKAQRI